MSAGTKVKRCPSAPWTWNYSDYDKLNQKIGNQWGWGRGIEEEAWLGYS